jgi:hypothetical protein
MTAGLTESELETMARDAADEIMGRTIRGVYKAVFALVVSPGRYVKHIDKIWRLHYDTGEIRVLESGAGIHRLRYQGWKSHHPFICKMNSSAGYAIYGAMGCHGVRVSRLGCVSEGAATCETQITWRA